MPTRVEMEIALPYKLTQRDRWVVASCPVLDVHSQGDTTEQAIKNLTEAISLFLITCFEEGTLEAVLKDCGFSPAYSGDPEQQPLIDEQEYLNIPLPFIINSVNSDSCHA